VRFGGNNTNGMGFIAILGILVCFDTDSKKLFVVRGFEAKMSVNLTCKILGFM
jgi:hypothetical protein